MTCRRLLVIAIAASGGCEDVLTLYETTTALAPIDLAPPDDHIPPDLGHYLWELVEAPPRGALIEFSAEDAAISITPPVRGTYVFDRWFVSEAAEQLSSHIIVNVEGASPTALIVGQTMATIGATATLDGQMSSSPEGLALTFAWRLAFRPASSTAEPGDATSSTLMLVPDVAGDYGIELRVFDGELWSQPAMTTLKAR